ncbi:hypothetical protein AAY473_036499 [Plecturocebus cupreus]
MTAPSVFLTLKTFQWDKMWRWKTVILKILILWLLSEFASMPLPLKPPKGLLHQI